MNISGIQAAIRSFTEAMQGKTVTEAQVVRRWNVCQVCPYRRRVTDATSRISQVLGAVANRNRVPEGIKDYKCGVCGCALLLLLPARAESLHKDTPEEARKRPATCWLQKALDSGDE